MCRGEIKGGRGGGREEKGRFQDLTPITDANTIIILAFIFNLILNIKEREKIDISPT